MSRHKFPTIEEQGGLEQHVEKYGVSWKLFVTELTTQLKVDGRANIARLHRLTGKDRKTLAGWVARFKAERGISK